MSAPKELKISTLGIIAGGGDLPRQLAQTCKDQNIQTNIIGIKNHVDHVTPDITLRIGQAAKIISFFKNNDVSDIVFIGSVTKPTFFTLWPDWMALQFFIKAWIGSWGDDNLLKGAKKILNTQGLSVRGVHEFLPNLLMPRGVLGDVNPNEKHHNDIAVGLKESQKLGLEDKGQAVLVKNGEVIACEDAKGTSSMIRRFGEEGAILVKTCKPQQDRDLDLPTLGSNTIHECINKNMAGIVGQTNLTLLVDREKMVSMANKANLFLIGKTLDE